MSSIGDSYGPISVEIATRWEAVSLLRLLDRFRPWTVQLAPERWVVVGRLDSAEGAETARELIAAWAVEGGRDGVRVAFGEDATLVPAETSLQA